MRSQVRRVQPANDGEFPQENVLAVDGQQFVERGLRLREQRGGDGKMPRDYFQVRA